MLSPRDGAEQEARRGPTIGTTPNSAAVSNRHSPRDTSPEERMNRIGIASLLVAVACSSTATAQSAGSLGLTFQTPAALGVLWHASESLALHPELTFSRTTNNSGTASESTTNSWGIALGAPFYMSNADNLRTYLSPRIGYASSESGAGASSGSSTQLNLSVSYGVHYSLSKRLAAFGETGLAYTDSKTEFGSATSNANGFGLRSSIGLALYSGR
jgi:hypothetical protein